MHVGHRGEAHREAEGRQLARLRLRDAANELLVVQITDAAHGRQLHRGSAEPHDAPALLIDGHQRRQVRGSRREHRSVQPGDRLHPREASGGGIPGDPGTRDVAPEQHDASALARFQGTALGTVELGAGEPDHEHLAAENGQRADHPLWSTSFRP